MESIGNFVHLLTTVEGISEIIRFGGLMLLMLIVFAETGLLVGFFLPGDSLLVTTGFLAATTDVVSIWPVIATLSSRDHRRLDGLLHREEGWRSIV